MRPILLFLVLGLYSFTYLPITEITTLEDGLIAHYNFNDCTATDISGNGSNGELFGGVTCWCGIEDDGMLLDGINDYLEFEGKVNLYFTTSDFTLSFFIRSDQYSIFEQSLFSKREDCGEEKVLGFSLNRNLKMITTAVQENEYKSYRDISPEIDGGGWQHIVLVREGREARTFVNGYLQKSVSRCSGIDLSNTAKLSFSNSPCLTEKTVRFKGILDEVRVYDRAISASEVEAIYQLTPIERAKSDCVT